MSALRLARGFTGRPKIVKFEGCYHGHGDSLLVRAGSGVATLGLPDSPGVLPEVAQATLTIPFNDTRALTDLFEQVGSEIAAVIIEPVPGNMGCILPEAGFLEHLRRLTREHNAVLIFDEVMTGFRIARGGAQEYYSIESDLTCLGKIIGGGLPVGAFGGRDDLMDQLAPVGPVYQAGTLSGNPLAVTAGLTALRLIKELNIYEPLDRRTESLVTRITAEAQRLGVELRANRVGSMFTLFFTSEDVRDWTSANKANRELYARFFHAMLSGGVYLPPSQFEACFVSTAHSDDLVDATVNAAATALARL
jgi:glutamate-1-semialdehyde 2,1-aminomutase